MALDFAGDFYDDPTIQLTKYVSQDLSPVNSSGSQDRFLDALFIGQAMTADQGERAKILRAFRAARADRGLYRPPVMVESDRRHIRQAERLAYHAQPFHRPRSGGCLAEAVIRDGWPQGFPFRFGRVR